MVPPFPPVDNFFTLHLTKKILLNIKHVEFDSSMGCILVLFPFLSIINVQFSNFGFLNSRFFYFQIKRYWLTLIKNSIFIVEITLKLLLHTKYGWNNPNWGRLGLKSEKLHFFAISGSSKFISHKHSNIWHGLNFHCNSIFLKCS